jgi:membrane protein DedA with SNARE-associated domain
MEMVTGWIVAHGYTALFCFLMLGIIGIPFPDDLILAFAGYLVFTGHLDPIPTFVSAFTGGLCGITVSYGLGRFLGVPIIQKYGHIVRMTAERLNKVTSWYQRFGKWGLLFAYFFAGPRHSVAFLAGVSKLRMPVFALFAYSGAFIWAAALISAGYVLGEEWPSLSLYWCGWHMYIAGVLCSALAFIGWLMHRRFKTYLLR